jgi:hypothetical protein
MIPKTLLTLIEGYNSLYSKVGEHKSFNTEKLKHLVSNPKGSITIGSSICFAVKTSLIRKEKAGVYYFTRKPYSSDIEKIFKLLKDHATDRLNLKRMDKKLKQTNSLFNNTATQENTFKKAKLLEDASIHDIVNRIKELGYTGELTPIKKTILII